jgi:hypothetical protein
LIKKAFETTGLSPLNPNVVLERFKPDTPDNRNQGQGERLDTWHQQNRRFQEVVKDPMDPRTMELNRAFHQIYNRIDIHQHRVTELEEALGIKRKLYRPGKPLQCQDNDGGAMFYSPRAIEEERHRIETEEQQKEAEKQRKFKAAVARRLSKEAQEQAVAERKAERARVVAENKVKKAEAVLVKQQNRLARQAVAAAKRQINQFVFSNGGLTSGTDKLSRGNQ